MEGFFERPPGIKRKTREEFEEELTRKVRNTPGNREKQKWSSQMRKAVQPEERRREARDENENGAGRFQLPKTTTMGGNRATEDSRPNAAPCTRETSSTSSSLHWLPLWNHPCARICFRYDAGRGVTSADDSTHHVRSLCRGSDHRNSEAPLIGCSLQVFKGEHSKIAWRTSNRCQTFPLILPPSMQMTACMVFHLRVDETGNALPYDGDKCASAFLLVNDKFDDGQSLRSWFGKDPSASASRQRQYLQWLYMFVGRPISLTDQRRRAKHLGS